MLRDPHERVLGDAPRGAGEPPHEHLGVAALPDDASVDPELAESVRRLVGDPVRLAYREMVGSHLSPGVAPSLRRRRP